MSKTTIWVGSDHAGFPLKKSLMEKFAEINWHDQGTFNEESVDYPDFASKVATELKDHPDRVGLLICGSGQGMAMRANRFPWIRAALCWSEQVAKLARQHNDANVLCLSGRLVDQATNEK